MAWPELAYSKSQVKRAGKILRDHHTHVLSQTEDDVRWATEGRPELASCPRRGGELGADGMPQPTGHLQLERSVTQRLKELPTMVRKLVREEGRVQLSTMEDIAGARAVVSTIEDARALADRWRRASAAFPIRRDRDYIDDPPASGYRAVHLVLNHKDRLVEVQVRTQIQNAWAELVEDVGHRLGVAAKNGEGPPETLAALRDLSDELSSYEPTRQYAGDVAAAMRRIDEFRREVERDRRSDG